MESVFEGCFRVASGSTRMAAPTHGGESWDMKHQTDPTRKGHGLDGLYEALRRLGVARGSDGRWFAGVAAGVARRLGIDPLVVRAAFILLGMLFGIGLSLYFLLWLVLPDEQGRIPLEQALKHGEGHSIFLLIVTAVILFGGGPWFSNDNGGVRFFGFAAVTAGAWWFLTRTEAGRDLWRSGRQAFAQPPPATTPASQPAATPGAPVTPGAGSPSVPTATSTDPTTGLPVGLSTGNAAANAGAAGWAPPTGQPNLTSVTVAVPTPPAERTRGIGFAGGLLVLGAAILAGVGVHSAATRQDWQGSHLAVGIAGGLVVLGLGILVSGLAGRRAGWLAPFALLAMTASLFTTVMPHGLTQPFSAGERHYQPTTLPSEQSYQLGLGRLDVDLTRAALGGAGVERVVATMGLGEINLVVPEGVRVTVHASGRAGEILALDSNEGGSQASRGGTALADTFTYGPADAAEELVVDAEVGLGQITIRTGARP